MIPAELQRRDLRRLVKELWDDPRCDHLAVATVDAAVAANAQSLDRSVLTAYLRHFPREHPAFEHLRSAARFTASRRPWDWRARGETWQLWDHDEAPKRLARSLLESETGAVRGSMVTLPRGALSPKRSRPLVSRPARPRTNVQNILAAS